jgi:cell division protein FtsQ
LTTVVLGLLIGGAAWGVAWVSLPGNVPVALVRVDGDIKHTKREMLRRALADRLSDGFFGLNLDAIREAAEALPWVTQASVRRVWPGTLVIRVREREALALWGDRGAVSPEGEVFWPDPDSVPRGLPRLTGPEGSAAQLVQRFQRLGQRVAEKGLSLTRLDLSERHAWTLELSNGLRMSLGTRDPEGRLDRVLRHLPALGAQGEPELVDARYANGFAVRWRAHSSKDDPQAGTEG